MVGLNFKGYTAQKGTFSMKHFFSKCDQIAGNCIFGHITQGIFKGKLNFFAQCHGYFWFANNRQQKYYYIFHYVF